MDRDPFELLDQLTDRIDRLTTVKARAYLRLARRHADEYRQLIEEELAAEDGAGR